MPTYLNNGLSIKTVAAIKAELQNMGVPATNITVEYTQTTDQNADGYVIGSTPAQGDTFKIKDTKIVLTVLQFDSATASKAASESASQSKSESDASASALLPKSMKIQKLKVMRMLKHHNLPARHLQVQQRNQNHNKKRCELTALKKAV